MFVYWYKIYLYIKYYEFLFIQQTNRLPNRLVFYSGYFTYFIMLSPDEYLLLNANHKLLPIRNVLSEI